MPGQLNEIIGELERQRTMLDRALAALRGVDAIESPAPGVAIAPPVGAVRQQADDNKGPGKSYKKRSTPKKSGGVPPAANASASDPGKPVSRAAPAKKLTEGTMKARTVELLRKAGKPMQSGEVARRMKIGAGYASVNLSQLRRDGFLDHTAAGYVVK